MKRNITISLFIICLVVSCIGCDKKDNAQSKAVIATEINQSLLFETTTNLDKSVNYLFFDLETGNKTIDLPIITDITDITQLKLECYQDDQYVTDQINAISYNDESKILNINLTEFVESFNLLKISFNKISKTIHVGQYYFETAPEDTLLDSERLTLGQYHTRDLINSFEGNFEFDGNGNESKIECILPQKMNHLDLESQLTVSDNNISYKCSFSNDNFIASDIEYLAFDMILSQTVENDSYCFLTCNIPLEPN